MLLLALKALFIFQKLTDKLRPRPLAVLEVFRRFGEQKRLVIQHDLIVLIVDPLYLPGRLDAVV